MSYVSRPEIEGICVDRLERWKNTLLANEATPFALVGVGHNGRCGKIDVFVLDGLAKEAVAAILRAAADQVEE